MGGCGGTFLRISRIERRGRREIEQPKVGPKGESRPSGKVEIDCRKVAPKEELVGRPCESTERERTSQL
jgi:hypothetical protein